MTDEDFDSRPEVREAPSMNARSWPEQEGERRCSWLQHSLCITSVVLIAAGCGSTVRIGDSTEPAPPDPVEAPVPPDQEAEPDEPARVLCGADPEHPEAPLLYTYNGADLEVLTAAGETRVLHTFFAGEDVQPEQFRARSVVHNNGWIAARTAYVVANDAPEAPSYEVEYVLLSEGQRLEWSLRESGYHPYRLYVGEDGTVIADRGHSADGDARLDGLLVRPDGQPTNIVERWPIAKPVGGAVPVCGETSCAWLDLESGLAGSSHDYDSQSDWMHFWGDRWFYGATDSATTIVAESAAAQTSIHIAGAPAGIRPVIERQRWIVFADHEEGAAFAPETGTTLWRVDLETGMVATHTLAIPEGLVWIDSSYCQSRTVMLTVDGDLFFVLRDPELARVHRVDFHTGASTTIGDPLSEVLAVVPFSVTETTTVIGAASGADTFCIIPEWEPTDELDVLFGNSTQLLVGDKQHLLPNNAELYDYHHGFNLRFDRRGRCVAYVNDDDFEIFDVETEEKTTLDWRGGGWLDPGL